MRRELVAFSAGFIALWPQPAWADPIGAATPPSLHGRTASGGSSANDRAVQVTLEGQPVPEGGGVVVPGATDLDGAPTEGTPTNATSPKEATADTSRRHDHAGPHEQDSHLEVTVHGARAPRTERRGSGDFFLHREVLTAAPHQEGADVLRAVPGLFLSRTEGLAVAHSLSIRGFDSEHGQDVAIVVGGLPVNLPSHIHAQGYADLGFLVSDVVDQLAVKEGVLDPRQGDFAVAGSIDIGLGVDDDHRGLHLSTAAGSFGTLQQKVVWAPSGTSRETFAAGQASTTQGFGENRAGRQGSGIFQHRFGRGALTYRAVGLVHSAAAASAGVVRRGDADSGAVCFTCVYNVRTAREQGTNASRLMAGLFADYAGSEHSSASVGAWAGTDDFRSLGNFTGFVETAGAAPGASGHGDLILQLNRTHSLGALARYRTRALEAGAWAHGTVEVGVDGRLDQISQGQSLLDAEAGNRVWDERLGVNIQTRSAAVWADLDWQFGKLLTARVGLRSALASYEVMDELGSLGTAASSGALFEPTVAKGRGATSGTIGPRSSLEFKARPWLSLLGGYGRGYRSPQGTVVASGHGAPFTTVDSADLGARFRFGEPMELALSGYYTHLSDDLLFEATEGHVASAGPSRRLGISLWAKTHPTDWLLGTGSVTYVDAVLEAPAAAGATREAPVPGVSPLVVRLDIGTTHGLGSWGGFPMTARFGAGWSFLAQRPLPDGDASPAVGLLDASATWTWQVFELGVSTYNLLDQRWASEEFSFVSNWDPSRPAQSSPARHTAAGAPLSLMMSLAVTL